MSKFSNRSDIKIRIGQVWALPSTCFGVACVQSSQAEKGERGGEVEKRQVFILKITPKDIQFGR